ncbi:MAG: DUF2760 domain-containing protein [Puniceicoccales bacterium]
MKTILLIGGLLVALLNGLTFAPQLAEQTVALNALGVVAGLGLAIAIAARWPKESPAAPAPEPEEKPAVVESAPPPKPAPAAEPDHAELLQFLAQLQEKGRFVDFVMDDVAAYTDAQVGAAARVVHQGCQSVMKDALAVEPVVDQAENSAITLEPGYAVSQYRLVGKVQGEPPYEGQLIHKGWKATAFKLPKLALAEDAPLPPIAPAQVELK